MKVANFGYVNMIKIILYSNHIWFMDSLINSNLKKWWRFVIHIQIQFFWILWPTLTKSDTFIEPPCICIFSADKSTQETKREGYTSHTTQCNLYPPPSPSIRSSPPLHLLTHLIRITICKAFLHQPFTFHGLLSFHLRFSTVSSVMIINTHVLNYFSLLYSN